MKTEDVVTMAVLGITIYAVLKVGFGKPASQQPTNTTQTSPIPLPGGVNPATLNNSTGYFPPVDFGLTDPTGNWA